MLNCLIIDDEPIARKLLQEYVEETDFLKLVGSAENPLKAMGLISSLDIDLIFLDINMPKMNGLDFLKSSGTLPMVIITTAYGQYALDGFELAVIDYLVKPFSLDRFLKASQKALELFSLKQKIKEPLPEESAYFFVKSEGKIEKILFDDLISIEALSNYLILHTTSKKLIVYLTMKGILEKLPATQFLQVHKSYIVNIQKVRTIEGNMLHLAQHTVPIGTSFADSVMERILKDRFFKR